MIGHEFIKLEVSFLHCTSSSLIKVPQTLLNFPIIMRMESNMEISQVSLVCDNLMPTRSKT